MAAMNKSFQTELFGHGLCYIDDLILHSTSVESHFKLLQTICDKSRAANLRLNPDKCAFFCQKLIFLGFEINHNGIRVDPARFEALRTYPSPKNEKGVRAVIGLFYLL